jgi:hypothetical protein
MKSLILLALFAYGVSFADDIYLKTGFVFRNVQVVDTAGTKINIRRDGKLLGLLLADVVRIESKRVDPSVKSAYELYSKDLYLQYQARPAEKIAAPTEQEWNKIQREDAERTRVQSADVKKDAAEDLLNGFYIKGGRISFTKALVMNYNGNEEIWLDQSKSMWSFGLGYDYLEGDSWGGFGASVHYSSTTLNSFSYQVLSAYSLSCKDVSYSLLLFDGELYLVPSTKFPFAFTLGFTLGSSIHGYDVTGNTAIPVHGRQSFSIFRAGYILGCKIMPLRILSLELEYRPMAAYSYSTSYEIGDFAYSKDGVNYYWATPIDTSEGMSETMFLMGLSIHF